MSKNFELGDTKKGTTSSFASVKECRDAIAVRVKNYKKRFVIREIHPIDEPKKKLRIPTEADVTISGDKFGVVSELTFHPAGEGLNKEFRYSCHVENCKGDYTVRGKTTWICDSCTTYYKEVGIEAFSWTTFSPRERNCISSDFDEHLKKNYHSMSNPESYRKGFINGKKLFNGQLIPKMNKSPRLEFVEKLESILKDGSDCKGSTCNYCSNEKFSTTNDSFVCCKTCYRSRILSGESRIENSKIPAQ